MLVTAVLPQYSLKGPDTPTGDARPRPIGPGPSSQQRTPLILLVEDEPLVRRTIARMLEEEGYAVVAAEHGLAAQELLSKSSMTPDLIVTDLRMPFLNGAELGEVAARLRPGLPVLYMSGFGSETSAWISPEALDSCYLAKPFSRQQLMETIQRCLRGGPSRAN